MTMANGPDLDEMNTTTLRNRSAKPKKANFGGKKAPPFTKKSAHMAKNKDYEGSPEDEAEDRAGAKRLGMSKEEYEGSPQDEAEDKAGMDKKKGHFGIMIAIGPAMSNHAQEHRSSVRDSINKSIKQIKRRK